MESQPNSIADRAVAAGRRELFLEAARGRPVAQVRLTTAPWSCDRLGPSISSIAELRQVCDAVLDHRNRRKVFFDDDHLVPWIERPEVLVSRFLNSLTDPEGRSWSEFAAAARRFARRGPNAFENDPVSSGPQPQFGRLRDDRLRQRRRVAALETVLAAEHVRSLADDAMGRGFSVAFREGRILVFEERGSELLFRPPDTLVDYPPIEAADHSDFPHAEMKEIQDLYAKSSFRFNLSPNFSWSVQNASQQPLISLDEWLPSSGKASQPQFLYLITSDLVEVPSLKLEQRELTKPGPRIRGPGRPSKEREYHPYVEEARERFNRGEFANPTQAARAIVVENLDAVEQFTTEGGAIR